MNQVSETLDTTIIGKTFCMVPLNVLGRKTQYILPDFLRFLTKICHKLCISHSQVASADEEEVRLGATGIAMDKRRKMIDRSLVKKQKPKISGHTTNKCKVRPTHTDVLSPTSYLPTISMLVLLRLTVVVLYILVLQARVS